MPSSKVMTSSRRCSPRPFRRTGPPEHHDIDTLGFWRHALSQQGAAGWWLHYVLVTDPSRPTLIGTVSYQGPPADGVVEIGYSVVPSWQRKGLATESPRGPARGFANHQVAGGRRSGKPRKGSKRLDWALEEAALAVTRARTLPRRPLQPAVPMSRAQKHSGRSITRSSSSAGTCWPLASSATTSAATTTPAGLRQDHKRPHRPTRTPLPRRHPARSARASLNGISCQSVGASASRRAIACATGCPLRSL
jgi:hypothetical protein